MANNQHGNLPSPHRMTQVRAVADDSRVAPRPMMAKPAESPRARVGYHGSPDHDAKREAGPMAGVPQGALPPDYHYRLPPKTPEAKPQPKAAAIRHLLRRA